jgi:uncharacterized membrane protein YccC
MSTPAGRQPRQAEPVRDSLREAFGASLCWLAADWLRLDLAYLSVITLHMVNSQMKTSVFQRGVERFVGRALGVVCALGIVTLFHHTPLLGSIFTLLGVSIFSYINFAGWWSYTFLNGGLYLVAIVEIGHQDPAAAFTAAGSILPNILLGIVVADLVNWLLGVESSLALQPGPQPLWPLRREWISQSLMVAATAALTQVAIRLLGWTGSQALITVMVLTVVTDRQALLRKGLQRIGGAVLGAGWGFASAIVLMRVERLPVALALFFLGMFVAGYCGRASSAQAYTGVQMAFVIALVLVGPPALSGNLSPVVQRIEGALVGMGAALLISVLWPTIAPAPAPQER